MERASGCIYSITRFLSYLLAGLLAISLPLAILANNALRTFFSPDEVSNAVSNLVLLSGGLREQLTDNIVSEMWSEIGSIEDSRITSNLSPADRVEVGQILFPRDWVRTQVQENLGILMEWVESEEPFPKFFIDLNPLRNNLRGGGAFRIAEIWVDSLPPCTREQITQLESALQRSGSTRLNVCRPEGELRSRLIDDINQKLIQQLDNMPGEISLLEGAESDGALNALDTTRKNILGFLLLTRWMRLLPFLFMGLVMTFAIRSWQDLKRWWGIPIALGSVFLLMIILIGNSVGPGFLKNAVSQSAQPLELQESIVNTIWDLLSSVLNRSAFQALVLLIIVGASFILPTALRRKGIESTSQPETADVPIERVDEFPSPPQVKPFQPETITNTPTNDEPADSDE